MRVALRIFSYVRPYWRRVIVLYVALFAAAAIGGQQLSSIDGLLGARPGLVAGAEVIFWLVVPVLAFVAFVTVIGTPIGITLLVVVAPLLWGLGYVTASTQFGFFMVDLRHAMTDLACPYLEAVLGVIMFQFIGLIPVVGGIVVALAGLFGSGTIIRPCLAAGWYCTLPGDRATARRGSVRRSTEAPPQLVPSSVPIAPQPI